MCWCHKSAGPGLVAQCLSAPVNPGAACANSVFPCSCSSTQGQAQSNAHVPGSRGKTLREVKVFACLLLSAPVPRFSYMIEQLTAAKSLQP